MRQTILTSRKKHIIDNLTVVNGEITASKNLVFFTDMTRLIPFTKPQDIYFDMELLQHLSVSAYRKM